MSSLGTDKMKSQEGKMNKNNNKRRSTCTRLVEICKTVIEKSMDHSVIGTGSDKQLHRLRLKEDNRYDHHHYTIILIDLNIQTGTRKRE